jgi:hypothetical protein
MPVGQDALLDVGGPAVLEAALDRAFLLGEAVSEQAVVDDLAGAVRVSFFLGEVDRLARPEGDRRQRFIWRRERGPVRMAVVMRLA